VGGLVALVALAATAACSGDARLPGEVTGSVPSPSTTVAPPAPECTPAEEALPAVRTYPAVSPDQALAEIDGFPSLQRIRDAGRLVVGVSGDTLLFGARNPLTARLEGFDIDVLTEVARAVFGPDGEQRIVYRVITYAQRLPALEARDVDLVAHTMTINCRRWKRIAFSSVYYQAGQKVLVTTGSGYDSVDDLVAARARVCAPEGSTNIDEISKPEYEGIVVVPKPDISDCLVAMQQGEADATTGDDTVLAGFAAQDPSTEVVGDAFTEEPYGIGVNRDDVDLVRFVNGVLAEMAADGRLDDIARRWLVDTGALSADALPPVPPADESRELP
jgi:polar amino acid transport system substrate-binding protein